MADLLIKHLKEKGKEHSALELLVNQWGFDEQLIPKALQTIGTLFSHYSRHDESHSKQILINIERLLGSNIDILTATDTWLLLEAAYWHDIGMVVPEQDIEDALKTEGFNIYIESIRNSPQHDLHNFCQNFSITDLSSCFAGAESPARAAIQFRELMAEWFRRQHAERSERIVKSPWDSVGITSPRTELIPARLFKVLGKICQMHGEPFENILKVGGLPFREAGMAQEDCHPRFVACLLRMGDLLDLDDNRFCPVMQRIAGENRPKISKAHEDKHAGMRHLRIDREYIEATAECDTIDGYLEAFKWFDWLKQEIQSQMSNWQEIVPDRKLGLMPMLKPISVNLRGKYQILGDGKRPQFNIDIDKAKELLQGSNLYEDKISCIRELLQNAVDATLLRVWLTRKKSPDIDWTSPAKVLNQHMFNDLPITVNIIEKSQNDECSKWEVTINDNGTGISKDDLAYMLNIGGSYRNIKRQNAINSMPEWMKPSGTFGIGFQSVFLFCDEVVITSKNILNSEILKVSMYSPTGPKEGLVLVQMLDGDLSKPCGTEVKFLIEFDSFPRSYSMSMRDWNSTASKVVRSIDPVLDSHFPYDAARILDSIQDFSKNSLVPVFGILKAIDEKHDYQTTPGYDNEELDDDDWNFLKIDENYVRLKYQPSFRSTMTGRISSYYRGQSFSAKNIRISHLKLELDLMSGKAGKWLTASRDDLLTSAEDKFKEIVLNALVNQIEIDLGNTFKYPLKSNKRANLSFFLEVMKGRYAGRWDDLSKIVSGEWLGLEVGQKKISYQELLSRSDLVLTRHPLDSDEENLESYDAILDGYALDLFLEEWINRKGGYVKLATAKEIFSSTSINKLCYVLSDKAGIPFTNQALSKVLIDAAESSRVNRRYLLQCFNDRWIPLVLKSDVDVNARKILDTYIRDPKYILLPYLFKNDVRVNHSNVDAETHLDSLCEWVRPRLVNEISKQEIKKIYIELIFFIDNEVMQNSEFAQKWNFARENL